MSPSIGDESQRLRRYLLGTASDEEKTAVEDGYFENDERFASVQVAEDELIEAYVRGELTPGDEADFRRHFLESPRRRELTDVAAAMWKTFGAPRVDVAQPTVTPAVSRPRGGLLSSALAAAAVFLLLGTTAWLAFTLREERNQAAQRAAAAAEAESTARREVERLASALREQEQALAAAPTIGVSLAPGIFRGGETPTIAVPAATGAVSVTLQTDVPPMAGAHTVVLRRESGDEIWRTRWVQAVPNRGATVVLIPATVLAAGRHVLEWSIETRPGQVQTIDDYAFVVRGRP